MDYVISFTPAQLVAWLLALCTGVVTITKAVEAVSAAVKKAHKPEADRDARGEGLEARLAKVEDYLAKDKTHLEALDTGNRVTQQALLALLGHAIDGNNLEQLKTARDSLHEYLIDR